MSRISATSRIRIKALTLPLDRGCSSSMWLTMASPSDMAKSSSSDWEPSTPARETILPDRDDVWSRNTRCSRSVTVFAAFGRVCCPEKEEKKKKKIAINSCRRALPCRAVQPWKNPQITMKWRKPTRTNQDPDLFSIRDPICG